MSPTSRLPAGLYAIADGSSDDVRAHGEALFGAGCRIVQLRCKGWPPASVVAVATRLRRIADDCGGQLIVNDSIEIAADAGAHGVHLGQGDAHPERARQTLGPEALIGWSTHTHEEVEAANAMAGLIDYIGFGPVYPTTTKRSAGVARGLEALARAVAGSRLPVVAIGGVHPGNLGEVRGAGAHGWAVVSALRSATDLSAVVRALSPSDLAPQRGIS